jgi:hypothetical protein
MTAEDARKLYYQHRVHLVGLLEERDRLLRSLQLGSGDTGNEGAYRATDEGALLRQIHQLTAEIMATTKLVNQYADQIGSPRVSE